MDNSVHFVMILEIKKITKTTVSTRSSPYNSYNVSIQAEEKKEHREVAKIVISDKDLTRLIERGGKHLSLVQYEETEISSES